MDSLGLALDFALEMLSGSHAQKKKKKNQGSGGCEELPSTDVMPGKKGGATYPDRLPADKSVQQFCRT